MTIHANFPWIPESADRNFVLTSLKGVKQHIRASDSFYNGEPQYDFIEFETEGDPVMGQMRCILANPHFRYRNQHPILALVRMLVMDEQSGGSFSRSTTDAQSMN